MRNKTSYIWNIDKDELQGLLDASNSIVEVLKKLKYDGYNGNHRTLNARIKEDKLSTVKLNANRKIAKSNRNTRRIPSSVIFTKDSSYNRSNLKDRILKEMLLDYRCSECDNHGMYNGKSLSLQLDHINGVNDDNRIENLRFLCPNCHSQTDTFSGKNAKHLDNSNTVKTLCDCGKEICKTSNKCIQCARIERRVVERPAVEILKHEVATIGYSATGRKYGVSDNAIRKWLK